MSPRIPIAMTPLLLYSIVIIITITAGSVLVVSAGDDYVSAYDVLESYDFPIGILPKGATGYSLDPSSGKFSLYLNGSCSFSLEGSYQLRYKSTISGYISKDRLTSLSGISVKILFLWVNIVEVTRKGDQLGFSVGIASAAFGIENFEICPQCGCGLDCIMGLSCGSSASCKKCKGRMSMMAHSTPAPPRAPHIVGASCNGFAL